MQDIKVTGLSFVFHSVAAGPGSEDMEFKADMSKGAPGLREQALAFYDQVVATLKPPVEYTIAFEFDRELTPEELANMQANVGPGKLLSYGPVPQ